MKHGELGNPHQTWRLVLLGKSPGNMGDFHRFTAGRPSGGHPRSRSQWGSFGAPKHHGILCVPWQRAAQSWAISGMTHVYDRIWLDMLWCDIWRSMYTSDILICIYTVIYTHSYLSGTPILWISHHECTFFSPRNTLPIRLSFQHKAPGVIWIAWDIHWDIGCPMSPPGANFWRAAEEDWRCNQLIFYILPGYGSIPIDTIFSGMNIHLPAILMFTRGTRSWYFTWNHSTEQSWPIWPFCRTQQTLFEAIDHSAIPFQHLVNEMRQHQELSMAYIMAYRYGSGSKPCTPVVHIKIAGKWMFIPLKMVLIGIDP